MYILGAVMGRQLPSLGQGSIVRCRLLDAKRISKIHCQVPLRCHAGRNIHVLGAVSRLGKSSIVFQPKRNYNRHLPIKRTFTPKYDKDNVSRDYELIYQANLGKRHSRTFIFLGAVVLGYIGMFGYFYLLFTGQWKFDKKTTIPVVNITIPSLTLQLSCFILTFVIIWLGVCNSFLRLPVQRIYESPCKKNYIGILKKNVFITERVEFDLSEVIGIRPTKGKILKNGNTNIKGRRCLIYAVDFRLPEDFNKFLGYDPVVPGQ
ncbi:uncharacterized protein LOC123548609 [Mercenaria mercenaria]|uniref:uncharacterized protein LOC123548609 n=1 Tax=Mercenaria mercenaria TaxID=6596 RepID=UPI00234F4C5B|nr:uncharacterized protein LOC123548609 [Mercenaria mercenaria]XP_045191969.2 uncharacterized protein LOC123548609 [Mercenaria mercenaria]